MIRSGQRPSDMKPAWQERLEKSISKNKRDAHNRYFQLATISDDGTPRVRMVVFRGFAGSGGSSPLIITDTRSQKVSELESCPRVEIGWYFTHTREQYRLRCHSEIFLAGKGPQEQRERAWSQLSEAARAQFFWKTPGEAEGAGDAPPLAEVPPDTFAVIGFLPFSVDHLILSKQQIRTKSLIKAGVWSEQRLNP